MDNVTKKCLHCQIEKPFEEFYAEKRARDGLRSECKLCLLKTQKKSYDKDSKKVLTRNKRWRVSNTEKLKEYLKGYYQKNKEKIKERSLANYKVNYKRIRKKQKEYSDKNKENSKEYHRLYRLENLSKIYAHRKNRRKTDINFRLSCSLRIRVCKVLRGKNKSASTLELLGCSMEYLKAHFESKFTDGMTWEVFMNGKGQIHIDHIRPCASFDLTDPAQQKACFHYSNLQPLWAKDNLSKGSNFSLEDSLAPPLDEPVFSAQPEPERLGEAQH